MTFSWRILRSKWRILRSPMPNEHPVKTCHCQVYIFYGLNYIKISKDKITYNVIQAGVQND